MLFTNSVASLIFYSLVGIFFEVRHGYKSDSEELASTKRYSYCQAPTPNPRRYKPVEDGILLSVHLIARHGDRTPTSFLPFGYEKDPWYCGPVVSQIKNQENLVQGTVIFNQDLCIEGGYCARNPMNTILWPGNCTSGQLTPKGISMLYELGKALKDIYIDKLHFISSDWKESKKHVFVRASDFQRTQQSAISVISGLFHSSISSISKLDIYSFPLEIETVFSNYRTCPRIQKIEQEIKASSIYKKYLDEVQPLRSKFESVLEGTRIGDHKDSVSYYVDVFQSRTCHGFPAVCKMGNTSNKHCITKSMIKKMMRFGNRECELSYRDHPDSLPVAARLRIGEVLLEMKRNILGAIEQDSGKHLIKDPNFNANQTSRFDLGGKKFFYFSAHDTTIAPILGAFQSFHMNWPPYASNFITELWTQPSSAADILHHYRLRFIYNGEPVRTPWCPSGTCLVENFLEHLDNKLGIVGGFENYGSFMVPHLAPPAWNMFEECWSDL